MKKFLLLAMVAMVTPAMAASGASPTPKDPMAPKVVMPVMNASSSGTSGLPALPALPGASVGAPIDSTPVAKEPSAPSRVSAILISSTKRVAIVDGKLVEPGSLVSGMKVKAIDGEGVDLDLNGQAVRLVTESAALGSMQIEMHQTAASPEASATEKAKKSTKKSHAKRSKRAGKK
jgi:hypothetical protein